MTNTNKFKIKKDGKECEIRAKETDKRVVVSTHGKDCKKLLGKDYFKNMEADFSGFI